MIGPNSTPIVPVPNRCSANSATRIAIEKGTICAASAGDATCRPDTADTTEIGEDPALWRDLVAELETGGMTRKEAILDVARRAGVPKREVYDAVVGNR